MTNTFCTTWLQTIRRRLRTNCDAGMATAEYAMATVAAVAFAGLLLAVLKSNAVKSALQDIITRALS